MGHFFVWKREANIFLRKKTNAMLFKKKLHIFFKYYYKKYKGMRKK